jgi:radical SAM/Cys-rich protein
VENIFPEYRVSRALLSGSNTASAAPLVLSRTTISTVRNGSPCLRLYRPFDRGRRRLLLYLIDSEKLPVPNMALDNTGKTFPQALKDHGLTLQRGRTEIFQLNVGKLCDLTCAHCHVNAGPKRKEVITLETINRILHWLTIARIPIVDITGGAPEMIPDFCYLVEELRKLPQIETIIDRCNLTILMRPGYEWLPGFLATNRIKVVASLPCYQPANVNAQRGEGVFDLSIRGLQLLNRLGYGRRPDLILDLVYNPNGDFLPPDQAALGIDYQRELKSNYDIDFNRLYTITNMPIGRFAAWLRHNGRLDAYVKLLIDAFNPAAVAGLMCRTTLSIGWQGEVYDCDFNQQLGLRRRHGKTGYLWELDPEQIGGESISVGNHCFGCTAGCGSSCGGALAST